MFSKDGETNFKELVFRLIPGGKVKVILQLDRMETAAEAIKDHPKILIPGYGDPVNLISDPAGTPLLISKK